MNIPNNKPKIPHMFNPMGFGKAGNNAISIMIAQGHFKGENLESELIVYKELTKAIYKADLESQEDIKEELC